MAKHSLSIQLITAATQNAQFDLLIKKVPVPELREILNHDDPINELYSLIVKDAALAALFLRVANSASLPVIRNTDDLKRAVTKLGTVQSVNLIITHMLRQLSIGSGYDISNRLINCSLDTAGALDAIQRTPNSYITGLALFGGAMLAAAYADSLGLEVSMDECVALNQSLLQVFIQHWSFPAETKQAVELYLVDKQPSITLAITAVAHKHCFPAFPGVDSSIPESQLNGVISIINANPFV